MRVLFSADTDEYEIVTHLYFPLSEWVALFVSFFLFVKFLVEVVDKWL